MKAIFRLMAMAMLILFMSACGGSSGGGDTDAEGSTIIDGATSGGSSSSDAGDTSGNYTDGTSTCIDLNALSTPSTISSQNGELDLIIILGSDDASVQYAAGNEIVWQNPLYDYTVSGNTISFTRSGGEVEDTYLEGLNPAGAVVPEAISITLDSNIVRAGVKFTYDGIEYTVISAFDNNLKTSCN